MKTMKWSIIVALGAITVLSACSKSSNSSGGNAARLQVRLTDKPNPDVSQVWIDVREIQIIRSDSGGPVTLSGAHPGVYNLLDLTNGKDTLLADAMIPAGTISQIRLILGNNNYIVTSTGEKISLKTPSGQESGIKVQVHQSVSGGILYRLVLDFDAGRSIVFAGNSGNVLLKPVIRILSFAPSGGDIKGIVVPASVRTWVFAIQGADTIGSTSTDTTHGNYFFKDVPAGNYALSYVPADTTYKAASRAATVVLGQVTVVDTVRLTH